MTETHTHSLQNIHSIAGEHRNAEHIGVLMRARHIMGGFVADAGTGCRLQQSE